MKYYVTINDKRYEVEVEKGEAAILSTAEVALGVTEEKASINEQTLVTRIAPETIKLSEMAGEENIEGEVVKAPMAGVITGIKVSEGSVVKIGDTLLMLEAMKMENEITAHVDGVIAQIKVAKGTSVSANDVLIVLK